jgi:hypothetical protein
VSERGQKILSLDTPRDVVIDQAGAGGVGLATIDVEPELRDVPREEIHARADLWL